MGLLPFGILSRSEKYTGCSEKDAFHNRSELKSQSEFAQLPGHGESDDDCGSPKGMHCSKCGNAFWSKLHCMNRECPECSQLWAAKEGRIASKRVSWGAKAYRKQLYEVGDLAYHLFLLDEVERLLYDGIPRRATARWFARECGLDTGLISQVQGLVDLAKMFLPGMPGQLRLVHVVISMVDVIENIDVVRATAREIARRHGLAGGLSVVHHIRTDKYSKHGDAGDGTVHVHIVGVAFNLTKGGYDFDAAGIPIVFKHIYDDEYKDYRGFRSGRAIKRTVQYLLTHCAIIEGKHALSWFGSLGYRTGLTKNIEASFPGCLDTDSFLSTPCPVCGSRRTEPCVQRVPMLSTSCSYVVGFNEVPEYPEPDYPFGETSRGESLWDMIRSAVPSDIHGIARTGLSVDAVRALILEGSGDLESVIEANIRSGRLEKSDAGILSLRYEFTLDKALNLMIWMTTHGVTPRSGDSELRKLVSGYCSDSLMDDSTFVFGPILERFERGCAGVNAWV